MRDRQFVPNNRTAFKRAIDGQKLLAEFCAKRLRECRVEGDSNMAGLTNFLFYSKLADMLVDTSTGLMLGHLFSELELLNRLEVLVSTETMETPAII